MKNLFKKIKLPKIKWPTKKFWLSKKFLISAGVVIVVVVGGVFIGVGMKKDSLYKTAMANIAEARYFMKSAQGGGLDVQFTTGIREEQYQQDGKATKPVSFDLVNLDTDSSFKDFDKIDGTIRIGADQFPISLLQNQYNALNFACDIVGSLNRAVTADEDIQVTLFISDTNQPTFDLQNSFGEDAISWNDALRAATDKIGSKIKNQKFETYVTILETVDNNAQWYVRFITDKNVSYFCVVAPDGSTIAQ